uniref:Uncharacterized protein n=1 Tax=Placozoan sp. BZ2423 TaxID=401705 RepID=A2T448_9METZ|nr:hypothetical protein [Placozoan sp. BZ2423]
MKKKRFYESLFTSAILRLGLKRGHGPGLKLPLGGRGAERRRWVAWLFSVSFIDRRAEGAYRSNFKQVKTVPPTGWPEIGLRRRYGGRWGFYVGAFGARLRPIGAPFGQPAGPFCVHLSHSFLSSWVLGLMDGAGVFKIIGAKKGTLRDALKSGCRPSVGWKNSPSDPPRIPSGFFRWLLFSSPFLKYNIKNNTGSKRSCPKMEFELILGPKEGATGYFLKKELGFGTISFDRKGSIKYHIKNGMHLNELWTPLAMPSILGRDPENPTGDPTFGLTGPVIKVLESAKGIEAVSSTRGSAPCIGTRPLLNRGANFNFETWLSGFFETTCSFQIELEKLHWSKMGKYNSCFFAKGRDPSNPGRPIRRAYPSFKLSFGIRADIAPPLFNPNRGGLNNVKLSIFVKHNNKIALSIIKNYFGGHIVKEGANPRGGWASVAPPLIPNSGGPGFAFHSNSTPKTHMTSKDAERRRRWSERSVPPRLLRRDPPGPIQDQRSIAPHPIAASFIYYLSNKKALKKLINVLERVKLKTKTRIEFLKWARIFRLIIESQTTSTPLTKRNKKRIKDFLKKLF